MFLSHIHTFRALAIVLIVASHCPVMFDWNGRQGLLDAVHVVVDVDPSATIAENAGFDDYRGYAFEARLRFDYDADDYEGFLETVTPHRRFKVWVTAEKKGLPAAPSDHVVLTKSIDES